MKITIISLGKAHDATLRDAVDDFTTRIGHYMPLEWKIVDDDEKMLKNIVDSKSGLKNNGDYVIALDEKGQLISSAGLADRMQKCLNGSTKRLVFLIGGAYGLTDEMRQKADSVVSLSEMTFPHQLVRLILAEQIYRACTILKGEKYHH
jgi:23S rRNA (pseudouridine1915-N3)-methyltransferase